MAPRHHGRDASLGQIPLSSGEIELYSRQDEAARRRHRLLAVREQERRLAQQVTQRYRNNLRKLQREKSHAAQKTLSLEQQKLLTDLHVHYQNSLQSMGTAQRNARLKLLELMEQAQEEQEKWTYNSKITGKLRTIEAEEAQEQKERVRTARRRQVEQNMERLRTLSAQQRRQASARARREHEVAMQRARDREELEKLRRMQSPEEVFVMPRPHEKDVRSYQFTRTHCVAPSMTTVEKPVTVIRHNRKHPTTMRGEEEAKKYSEEMDRMTERKRVIMEEQKEMAEERGKSALDDVTSRQKAQQAFEWLALVDKKGRYTRGQELVGGEDFPVDARELDGEIENAEQMAERAFARMLGLDEDSVDLSAFSIETDDDQSVGLADPDDEHFAGDKAAERDRKCRIELKDVIYRDSLGSLDGIESRLPRTGSKTDDAEAIPEKPLKASTFGDLQDEELKKLKQVKRVGEKSVQSDMSFEPRGGQYEDKVGKSGKYPSGDDTGDDGNEAADGQYLKWNRQSLSANRTTGTDNGRRQYTNGEERPEDTEHRGEELDNNPRLSKRDGDYIERLENRLQEVLDFRLVRPQQERPFRTHQTEDDLSSEFEAGQRVDQHDEVALAFPEGSGMSRIHNASDGIGNVSVSSEPVAFSASGRPLSPSSSGSAAHDEHRSLSEVDHRTVIHDEGSLQDGHLLGSRHASSVTASVKSEEMHDAKHIHSGDSSPIYPDGAFNRRLRDSSAGDVPKYTDQPGIVADNRLGNSASPRSSYRPGENDYDEAGRDSNPIEVRNRDAVTSQNKGESTVLGYNGADAKASPDAGEYDLGHLPRRSVQESDTDLLGSRQFSTSRPAQDLAYDNDDLPPRSSAAGDESSYEVSSDLDDKRSHMMSIDEGEHSLSESSFTLSQKSLSHLDEMANARAKSLDQRFIDQHMLSFSSSEGHNEKNGEAKTKVHRPSISNESVHPSVNVNPYDPYRRQMDHQARRTSTSAVSIAQYSLPPSDTHSSFDDSLDHLHPGYGDDSFVNELVPLFPKRALPPPQHSFEEDSQALEEYDVQLVAPNMSRMLTSERRTSFGRSRQHLVHYEPRDGSTERPSHWSTSAMAKHVKDNTGSVSSEDRAFSSSRRQSSSGFSNSAVGAESTAGQSPAQDPAIKHTPRPDTHQLSENERTRTAEQQEIFDHSNISSESGVSSLGFDVQLNLVAGTTRRHTNGDDRRDVPIREGSQPRKRALIGASDDDGDNQSIASEKSFASSSSISVDAHFNYLVNVASAVGKSLPLHLRLPAMIYGTKDMTKPPAPMAWSASSVSSIASVSEADPHEVSEAKSHSPRTTPPSNSSVNEEHHASARERYKLEQQAHGNDSHQAPSASEASSDSESTVGSNAKHALRVTFDSIKKKASHLPPPPLGSLNMSKPPPPMQTIRRLDESQSSSSSSSELRPSERRQLLPPPVHLLNMSQPPPPIQNVARSLDSSQLSSEQKFDERQSSEKRDVRRVRHSSRQPYEAEEEKKLGDSSSASGASHSDSSFDSSSTSSRRRSMNTAEKIVIPVNKSRDNNDEDSDADQGEKEMTLAEAFKLRHPGFGHRVESHRDKLKRQRDKPQQHEQQQRQSEHNTASKRETSPSSSRGRSAVDFLPPEKQELLDRLASGSRAKISSREMKERSRRLYHQLPEVVERKRQEEVMRRRRERLNELREQEKERRLQQKQRRQQQQKR